METGEGTLRLDCPRSWIMSKKLCSSADELRYGLLSWPQSWNTSGCSSFIIMYCSMKITSLPLMWCSNLEMIFAICNSPYCCYCCYYNVIDIIIIIIWSLKKFVFYISGMHCVLISLNRFDTSIFLLPIILVIRNHIFIWI